jgi:GR25 family glycosyltransferase involved in LPS biosynthesis
MPRQARHWSCAFGFFIGGLLSLTITTNVHFFFSLAQNLQVEEVAASNSIAMHTTSTSRWSTMWSTGTTCQYRNAYLASLCDNLDPHHSFNDFDILGQNRFCVENSHPQVELDTCGKQRGSKDEIIQMEAFYINMANSTARNEKMQALFGPITSRLHRVEAVTPADDWYLSAVNQHHFELYILQHSGLPSLLAVSMSHLRAVMAAYHSGAEVALIMEDDVSLDLMPMWTQSIDSYAASLPSGWCASQVGYTNSAFWRRERRHFGGKDDADWSTEKGYTMGTDWGAFAYIISREGMRLLIDASVPRSKTYRNEQFLPNLMELKSRCSHHIVADDCLLGFQPQGGGEAVGIGWNGWDKHVYIATPPFFTIDAELALGTSSTIHPQDQQAADSSVFEMAEWHSEVAVRGYCSAVGAAVQGCKEKFGCPKLATTAGNRCGDKWGDEPMFCNTESGPCCSDLGWCGNTAAHCSGEVNGRFHRRNLIKRCLLP